MDAALKFMFHGDEKIENLNNVVHVRSRVFRERRNYFGEYDETDFVRRFRLSKKSALDVLQIIEHKLEFSINK